MIILQLGFGGGRQRWWGLIGRKSVEPERECGSTIQVVCVLSLRSRPQPPGGSKSHGNIIRLRIGTGRDGKSDFQKQQRPARAACPSFLGNHPGVYTDMAIYIIFQCLVSKMSVFFLKNMCLLLTLLKF